MRKDDLSILQDYSKRDKEAGTAIEASKSKRYNDNIEGMKEADYGLFKDEMDQLAGIMHGLRLSTRAPKKDQRQWSQKNDWFYILLTRTNGCKGIRGISILLKWHMTMILKSWYNNLILDKLKMSEEFVSIPVTKDHEALL